MARRIGQLLVQMSEQGLPVAAKERQHEVDVLSVLLPIGLADTRAQTAPQTQLDARRAERAGVLERTPAGPQRQNVVDKRDRIARLAARPKRPKVARPIL